VPNAPRIELPRPAIIAALGALILAATFALTNKSETGTQTPAASSSPSTDTSASTTTDTSTTSTTDTTEKPAKKPEQPPVQAGQGVPTRVARALDQGKIVVLFFYEPAAADDQATKAAVRAVQSVEGTARGRVRLFSDVVARISNYRRVVGGLGISQSPAMVVIDKQRHAQLFEGYLDAGTIRQSVADAL
jgi:hypothetical protein